MLSHAERFRSRYGPWALVAGGSTGMGAAYSRQLAQMGLNVVLLAESAEPLQSLAHSLAAEHGVQTRSLQIDLATPDVLTQVDAVYGAPGIEGGTEPVAARPDKF
ncbi:MAG TPA: SDR family NAD(P)-dependent oxidoreductase [Terriglobales bacterium]|nr:SDR family NAD(P)-dependent oxidoreductase [Candidatus Binatia bacterium]HYD48398.1 SDR family NAD(P)-dependent oxidoreductase [Terriglobales bacterium]